MHEKRISESAKRKIEELCQQIAVGRGVDEQVRRELRDHMEDKLLAYLEGRELVSEEDALLLVERHFGEPATLNHRLANVHRSAAVDTIARRVAAIFTLGCIVAMAQHLLTYVIYHEVDWTAFWAGLPALKLPGGPWVYTTLILVVPAAGLLTMWGVLWFWNRRVERGKRLWFTTLPWWAIVIVMAMALAEEEFCMIFSIGVYRRIDFYVRYWLMHAFSEPLFIIPMVLLWMWWCGSRKVRSTWSALAGATGWMLWVGIRALLGPNGIWGPFHGGTHYFAWDLYFTAERGANMLRTALPFVLVALISWGLFVYVVSLNRGKVAER